MRLQLWDTAGQENFDKIRILCYENTKCFIVCFSVVDAVSFSNVKNLWVEEVRQHQPSAKILLVGTKSDLRGKNKDADGSNDSGLRGEDVSNDTLQHLEVKIEVMILLPQGPNRYQVSAEGIEKLHTLKLDNQKIGAR